MFKRKELDWCVGFSESIDADPLIKVHATVPGAVQLDWAKANDWEEYTYSDNYKDYLWMEDVYWFYTTKLESLHINENERIFFVCKGVDYKFQVKLGGRIIHEQEGMFTPFQIDITERACNGEDLEIIIFPVPKRNGAPEGRAQADQSCKPAVSYGWDWHPRLIPIGIWDETYLEIRSLCHIGDCEVKYDLSDNLNTADIKLNVDLYHIGEGSINWSFFNPLGELTFKINAAIKDNIVTGDSITTDGNRTANESITAVNNTVANDNAVINRHVVTNGKRIVLQSMLNNIQLWWPNGQGEANLYTSSVELLDVNGNLVQQSESKVGFRKVKLVVYPGGWDDVVDFPKSRNNPPITMEINNRQIFCKGSNWVNPEIFPGIITKETYEPLVKLAKEGNMNILRCWGGAIVNKESFFELCDKYGIMVWQEFPLACNNYEGTREYLKILDQESCSIIKRLRSHACVVMWCGGNELFNSWSKMTDQSLALRLLNRNCYDHDPHTPFIMTSPLMGIGHGSYLFQYPSGEDVFQIMPKASNTAYTEFGCPSPSGVEYLKQFIPENELFPPRPKTAWETHHAFNAWASVETWLCLNTIESYFGFCDSLEKIVMYGQLLQSEGYKCIYEEARRQKPKCSMALNWCYNEPWPTAANNSIINWPAIPKPAYYAVKASCRPILSSARIPKFLWHKGEIFNPELWILNDLPNTVPAGSLKAYIQFEEEKYFLTQWDYPELPENQNLKGQSLQFQLKFSKSGFIKLILNVEGYPEMDAEYILLYRN